jgi:hypothetical protein
MARPLKKETILKREAADAIGQADWCPDRTLNKFIRNALLREVRSRVSKTSVDIQRALIRWVNS